jgi:hypothetical protein
MSDYIINPYTLTILPTYQCTAACRSCSLECSPLINSPRIPLDRLKKYIKEAKDSFKTLKIVIFTGGECFLLGNDLFDAIKYANSLGLMTRCVSNGYWAASDKSTKENVRKLKESGITEMNFSTGDEHATYIPFERVLRGAITCAENEIKAIVSVEGHNNSQFETENIYEHKMIQKFFKNHPDKKKYLFILKNVWMSIHEDFKIEQTEVGDRMDKSTQSGDRGCQNVITNLVINPEEQLASCCGLTFENISEMKLGSLKQFSMKSLYEEQLDDFLKLWIYVEGPESIIEFAKTKNQKIELPNEMYHICETCAHLYTNNEIRQTIAENYHEKIDDIFFQLQLKQIPINQL